MKKFNKNLAIFIFVMIIIGTIVAYNFYNINLSFQDLFSRECPNHILNDWFVFEQKGDELFLLDQRIGIYPLNSTVYHWKDGQGIIVKNRHDPLCEKGSEKGQQINYFYCKDMFYSKDIVEYDNNGKIIESRTDSYKVRLVLNQKPADEIDQALGTRKYEIVSSKCT